MSKLLKNLMLVLAGGAVLAACSSTKAPVASEPVASESEVSSGSGVSNHNSVYFAFNKYDIQSGYNGVIQANANYLASNHTDKMQVQGNTDAVGSVEYNLALGNKRAKAVVDALVASGAKKSQLEAISYGKLKAKFSNDTDAGRAMNRRADMVYKNMKPQGYSVDSTNGLPIVDASFYNGTVVEGVQ